MTTANPCCPDAFPTQPINVRQPMESVRAYLTDLWGAWRKRQLERAKWQALEELSDATRRDLGLAERQLQTPGARAPLSLSLPWG